MHPTIRLVLALALLTPTLADASQYKILVTEARIATKKITDDGPKPWDAGIPRPDAYVVVEFAGSPVAVSEKVQDSYSPRWITGTAYWSIPKTTRIRIRVRDSDAGKLAARAGMAGVSVRSEIPAVGKQVVNDVLRGVDTDDTIAEWTGTLGQLLDACGGSNRTAKIASTHTRFTTNNGLDSLTVRVVERPARFTLSAKTGGSRLGILDASIEPSKRSPKLPWDAGIGGQKNPDPLYVIYVNGEPALAGGKNTDSFRAIWPGKIDPLNLEPDDIITISVLDADAGTLAAKVGKHVVLFSDSLSEEAKVQMFKELSRASTNDPIYLWVGTWRELQAKGKTFTLGTRNDRGTRFNNGLKSLTVTTVGQPKVAALPAMDVVVRRITSKPTKRDGKTWDAGRGNPDLFVKCFAQSPKGGWDLLATSKEVKDRFIVVPNLKLTGKRLTPGTRMKFEVYDKDFGSNDIVGTVVITIPKAATTLRPKAGQVHELVLEFVSP